MPKTRVLVVDDDAEMGSLITAFLRSQGYAVTLRHSVKAALSVLKSDPGSISFVVSDVRMHPLDGISLLEVLTADYPKIPVVLMTVAADKQQREGALKAGALAYLAKPFPLARLTEILSEELAKRR